MIARHFTELVCWQLSSELKRKIYAVMARPKVARDFKFCDQIRESARSAPRNIAEGFGKYNPPEFGRYLNIAAGSLAETQNHLRDAFDLQYVEQKEFGELWRLAKRARGATIALMNYLASCPRKGPVRRSKPVARGIRNARTPNKKAECENPEPEPTGRTSRKNQS
ncbi:MAG: four helix bundle protein [Acidobacteriota bacterium]